MSQLFAEYVISPIGATVRWAWGSSWRTLAGRKKYSFQEYLKGPKGGDPFFDTVGHEFNNRLIGAVVFVGLCLLLTLV
ncbi:MAG: hypothetical protein WD530_01355 [Vicingaceae bacterium]